MDLERGPVSLVSTIEELLLRKSNDYDPENREYGREDPLRRPHDNLNAKMALTSPTNRRSLADSALGVCFLLLFFV
jgi:hypothetical protein